MEHRRFRHRLFVAQLSASASGEHSQGRSIVRQPDGRRRKGIGNGSRHRRTGAQSGNGCRGRRRGKPSSRWSSCRRSAASTRRDSISRGPSIFCLRITSSRLSPGGTGPRLHARCQIPNLRFQIRVSRFRSRFGASAHHSRPLANVPFLDDAIHDVRIAFRELLRGSWRVAAKQNHCAVDRIRECSAEHELAAPAAARPC